jgi:hypothetical protein
MLEGREPQAGKKAGDQDGERLRAAVDRLHAAQLTALAAHPPTGVSYGDAFVAERQLLAQAAEIGSLLVELRQQDPGAEVAQVRLRLVALAVASATTLAALVGLAFEVESAAAPAPGAAEALLTDESQPTARLWQGLLLQVADMLPMAARLEARGRAAPTQEPQSIRSDERPVRRED